MNKLIENHQIVQSLWRAVNTSTGNLVNIAPLIRKLIDTEAWRHRQVPELGREVRFDSFARFLRDPPLEGCGWDPETVVVPLIRDDADTLRLFRKATTAPVGTNQHTREGSSNITTLRGTTRAYTLDRLERERPDLYRQVVEKTLSANAAAIEAGFRKRTFSVPDDLDLATAAIVRRFGMTEIRAALNRIEAT